MAKCSKSWLINWLESCVAKPLCGVVELESHRWNGISVVRPVKQLWLVLLEPWGESRLYSLHTQPLHWKMNTWQAGDPCLDPHGPLWLQTLPRPLYTQAANPGFGPVVMDLHFLLCHVICGRRGVIVLNIPSEEMFSVEEGIDSTVIKDF